MEPAAGGAGASARAGAAGAAGSGGSGRLGHGFGHAGSRHDRHGDAIDGLADLLGGLVERLAHVVGGFIERLANLDPGLRHDPMRVAPASAAARLASRLAADGGSVSFSDRVLCFTLSLGPGPADFIGGSEVARVVHAGAAG